MSELPNPIEPYQKLPIINFTIHPERTPFQSGNEQDGEEFPWDFTFEYRTPSGKEFCVSYFREDFGKSKFDRSAWRLDHINKWIDPSISEEIPEDGLRVSLEEAEQEIGVEGYSIEDFFNFFKDQQIAQERNDKNKISNLQLE